MLDRIASAIDEGLIGLDRSLLITCVNAAAARLLGAPPSDLEGQPLLDRLPPDAQGQVGPQLHHALTTGRPAICDVWLAMAGRTLEHRIYPSADGLAVLISDVTAARRAAAESARHESALRESRDVLALAMRGGRMGAWSWDIRSDLVTFSPEFAEIFGLPADRPAAWTALRTLLHPDDQERTRQAVLRAIETHGDYAHEYRVMVEGRQRWVAARGRPRYGADGVAVGMHGVMQDIGPDRLLVHFDEAVRDLATSEQIAGVAARMLGEYLGVDRCAYAAGGPDDDCIVIGTYAVSARPLAGRHPLARLGALVQVRLRAGEPVVVEAVDLEPSLSERERTTWLEAGVRAGLAVPILRAGGLEAGMVACTAAPRRWHPHEITLMQEIAGRCWAAIERARGEADRAALLARERMARLDAERQTARLAQLSDAAESANRAKDQFLAMLGHELRNPLAPILTALQLMRLRGDAGSDRERVVIERQVKHLTRLVDDLLDVSRIARGSVELKLAPVETSEVVARAIEMASPLLESRTHRLTVDVAREGLPVIVDAARLSQVLANLLTNAARYTPEGGTIAVGATAEPDEIRISVRDSGVGIAQDVLPTVFDLFVQGQQSSNRAEGGLGLGLAIVRNLVERHGGRVDASSAGLGHGSTFTVWVPRAPILDGVSHLPRATHDVASTPPVPSARVLIVDDNADAADMLAHVLTARGHQTRVAHDGVEALRACGEFAPDAAFLDLGLPVMDGYELASRLRALPGLSDIRLIAVTGYGQESDRQRTRAAGFAHHLVKPVDISTIEALLT